MHSPLAANMPRSAAAAVRNAGHECTHVRDTPLADAADEAIAAYARLYGLAILTRDFDFADERANRPQGYAGIAVLSVPETATAALVARLVAPLLDQRTCVAALPGRLAIVESGRVRRRPRPAEP